MTATDTIRAMLDERGVEWRERVWGGKHSVTTFWHARGVRWHYRENRFGDLRLHADGLSPEQAIEATLGKGECERLQDENERLRSCLSDSAENSKQILHEAHVQEEENAKLLELVRDMCKAFMHGNCYRWCEFKEPCNYISDGRCQWYERARELGVEV